MRFFEVFYSAAVSVDAEIQKLWAHSLDATISGIGNVLAFSSFVLNLLGYRIYSFNSSQYGGTTKSSAPTQGSPSLSHACLNTICFGERQILQWYMRGILNIAGLSWGGVSSLPEFDQRKRRGLIERCVRRVGLM